MADHRIARDEELVDGDRLMVELEGKDIGIFKIDGEYYAYASWCPHQSGPVCEGPISGTTSATFDIETLDYEMSWEKEGEIVVCPWHGWEYDLLTGSCRHDPDFSLVSFPVRVEDGDVVVSL